MSGNGAGVGACDEEEYVDISRVQISCFQTLVILVFYNNRKNIYMFQNNMKNPGCSQWCIPTTCQKNSNTLYSELHKNDRSVDLTMLIFKSLDLLDIFSFV